MTTKSVTAISEKTSPQKLNSDITEGIEARFDLKRPLDRWGLLADFQGLVEHIDGCGWVLNMGGPHGTPAVATEETIEQVQPQGSKAIGHGRRSSLMTTDRYPHWQGSEKVIFRR